MTYTKHRIPDGQELALYSEGNTSSGMIRMDGPSLKMNGGGAHVAISSGNNLLFQGISHTIGGTNALLSLGQAGDTIALDVNNVVYRFKTISGDVNITGNTTIDSGNLTLKKSGTLSTINFAPQTNDAGFIQHYENNNVSQLRFSVSDDNIDTDYFAFGSNPSGVWTETSKITAMGKAYFKYLDSSGDGRIAGDLTVVGNFTNSGTAKMEHITIADPGFNEGIEWLGGNKWKIFESNDVLGNTAGNLQITTASAAGSAGKMFTFQTDGNFTLGANGRGGLRNVNHIYFDWNGSYGTSELHSITSKSTGNLWINSYGNVTVNIDSNNDEVSNFFRVARHSADDTNPLFEVTDTLVKTYTDANIVGSSSTISGLTLANASLLIGTATSGIGIDSNEIYQKGDHLIMGVIDNSSSIIFRQGQTDLARFLPNGNFGIGIAAPTQKLDVNGSIRLTADIHSPSTIGFLNGGSAQKINTGGILVSSTYAEATNVPANGIWAKGDITSTGTITGTGFVVSAGTGVITHNTDDSYDKIRVWDSSSYTIGMKSAQSYGYLNDHAMTFTMNNAINRGFLWRDVADAASDGAMSLTTDGRLYVKDIANVGSLNVRGSATLGNATFDNGTSTTVTVLADDAGEAVLELMGDNKSTGRLYVGQSATHGGGIVYNGDGVPNYAGMGADYIGLYRVSAGTAAWTARSKHNSNNWEFRGDVKSATLNVTGAATSATLNVTGAATAATLNVAGLTTSATLNVTGAATINGDLNINGSKIGLGNDTDVIVFNDNNNETLANYYSNNDSVTIQGDSAPATTVVKTGNVHASETVYAGKKSGVGKMAMEWNEAEGSLDFVYYG